MEWGCLLPRGDHPRPCGEKFSIASVIAKVTGSPPPMRGKEAAIPARASVKAITPAHAGKRGYDTLPCGQYRDHPRPCGEKLLPCIVLARGQGSPPPMRGKACAAAESVVVVRITPAHAGKSCAVSKPPRTALDHPRPCGEKCALSNVFATAQGSPPPMRGKGVRAPCLGSRRGITPAHAGKSGGSSPRPRARRDHPRPCGEKRSKRYPRTR